MKDYASFVPKVITMPVGSLNLDVSEYTIAKRDAALKIILSSLDIATIVKPFWDAAKAMKKAADTQVDLVELAEQAKDVVLRVIGNDLTTISCLTLDTPQNRKKVAVLLGDPTVEQTEVQEPFGYVFSPKLFGWIRENLTARQEYQLFEAFFELNDFVGLVKNYVTLVVSTFQTARAKVQNP